MITSTATRNRKITHLIEAAISDLCKLFNSTYEKDDESIVVFTDTREPWFYLYPVFNKGNFEIIIKTFVYDNLPLSKSIKLREVYSADNINSFLNDKEILLHFHEDEHLLTAYSFEWEYKNYTLLKSNLIIEIYTQLQNVSEIRLALNENLEERERVLAN